MNAQQLLTLQNTAGTGLGSTLTPQEIAAWDVNTDWLDFFFRTGVSQNHVLSITNGGKNMSSFTSIAYFEQEGILINTDLKRFNFRNNVQGKALDGKLNYGTNFTANFQETIQLQI
jgi:TonB-dependent starch-binding outer membrane protein SusC